MVPNSLEVAAGPHNLKSGAWASNPHGGLRPFHQKSTCLTQLTSGPYVVHISSRYGRNFDPTKPAYPTVRVCQLAYRGLKCKSPVVRAPHNLHVFPNPGIQNPKPETRNRNPKPEARNTKPETRNPKTKIETETRSPKPEARSPKSETRNRNPKPETETRSPKPASHLGWRGGGGSFLSPRPAESRRCTRSAERYF